MKEIQNTTWYTTLFRPVDEQEMTLIAGCHYRQFAPTAVSSLTFYYALSQDKVEQIAESWQLPHQQVPGRGNRDIGFVLAVHVDAAFLQAYVHRRPDCQRHNEVRVPREELPDFNAHLTGDIRVIRPFSAPSNNNLMQIYAACRARYGSTLQQLADDDTHKSTRPEYFKASKVVAELAGTNLTIQEAISNTYPGMSRDDLTERDRAYIERNIFWHEHKKRWDYR